MSYTNPGGTSNYTLTAASGGLLVFNSVTDSSYTTDPYAKLLAIKGKGLTFNDITISSGGTVIISKHTVAGTNTLSNVQIYNGGLLSGQTGATIKNVTIHSGGSMQPAAGYLSGLTVESGADINIIF